jgi:O-antigen ligase
MDDNLRESGFPPTAAARPPALAANAPVLQAWLLAAMVYVGAHDAASIFAGTQDAAWPRGGLLPALALLNVALWLAWTRPRLKTPAAKAKARAVSPLLWVPAAYFALISLLYAAQTGALIDWCIGAVALVSTVLVMAALCARTDDVRPFFQALTAAGVVLCLEAVARLLQRSGDPAALLASFPFLRLSSNPDIESRLGGVPLPYPTMFVSLLIVFASVALGLLRLAKTPGERALWGSAFGLNALCIVMTGSRAGLIFFLVMTLLHLAQRGEAWRRAAIGGAVFLFGAALLLLARSRGGLLRGDASLKSRFHMWRVCLKIARDNPLFGGGPNAFLTRWQAYARYYGYPDYSVPHSLPMSLLADGGLLMLTMAALLLTGMAQSVRDVLRSSAPREARELVFSLALGLATTLAHDLIETSFRMVSIYLLTAALAGMLLGLQRRNRIGKRTNQREP